MLGTICHASCRFIVIIAAKVENDDDEFVIEMIMMAQTVKQNVSKQKKKRFDWKSGASVVYDKVISS